MGPSNDVQDVRVVHFGLGPLGAAMALGVAGRDGLVSVAAVDAAPAREGRDLGELLGLGTSLGVAVEGSAARLGDIEADVVLYAPDGDADAAIADLELLLEVGINVIAVMPALAYPVDDEAGDDLAVSIDALAREAEVTVVALDHVDGLLSTLPLVATGACASVDRMTVRLSGIAVGNARTSLAEWARAFGGTLGWNFDEFDEVEEAQRGQARAHHRITGSIGGFETLIVEVSAAADGVAGPVLTIETQGTPSLTLTVSGGADADEAVAALAVNAIPAALTGEPGLYTLADLPPVHSWTSLGLMQADDEDDEDE